MILCSLSNITLRKSKTYSILDKILDLRSEYLRIKKIVNNNERFEFFASLTNLKTPCKSLARCDTVERDYFYKTIPLGVDDLKLYLFMSMWNYP